MGLFKVRWLANDNGDTYSRAEKINATSKAEAVKTGIEIAKLNTRLSVSKIKITEVEEI